LQKENDFHIYLDPINDMDSKACLWMVMRMESPHSNCSVYKILPPSFRDWTSVCGWTQYDSPLLQ